MVPQPPRPPTSADTTRAYVDAHASIRSALKSDLVNFAFLARLIQSEEGLKNAEAIEIALRRYQQELRQPTPASEAVRGVLERSRIEVHSRLAILRVKEDWAILDRLYQIGRGLLPELRRRGVFELFQGPRALTILCEDDLLPELLEAIPPPNVLSVQRGLASIAVRSLPEVAETPGVLAALVERLFERGINCLETVSVHTDSIFVFQEKELSEAVSALSGLLVAGTPEPSRPTRRSARTA